MKKYLKTPLIVTPILLLALIVAASIHYYPQKESTDKSPTPSQKQAEAKFNSESKKQFIENGGDKSQGSSNSTATPTDTQSSNSDNITVSTRKAGNNLTVLIKLVGYSNGTCTLITSSGGKSNSQSAAVIYQSEFSTCAGFSVPISELGTGSWQLELTIGSNGIKTTKTLSVEVTK